MPASGRVYKDVNNNIIKNQTVMKKINFLVVALAVLALVGCKKEQKEVVVNSITLDQTEVTIKAGEEVKLTATIDPAGAANIEWKSSDTKVASVNAGLVKGIEGGTAKITATAGDKTATCTVTVVAAAEVPFNIEDMGLFGSEVEYIPGTERDIELTDGSTVHCQLGYIWCYGWDGDLQYIDGVGWAGEGEFIMGGQMPVYWIIEGKYKGYYIGRAYYTIGMEENDDDIIPYNMAKAHVDKDTYGDWVSYVHGDPDAPDLSGDGAQDYIWDKNWGAITTYWNVEEEFNYADYGLYEGYFNKMIFRVPDEEEGVESAFYADINWALNDEDHTFGFTSTYNATDTTTSFVRPYEFTYVNAVYDDDNVLAEYEEYMKPKEEAQYFICSPKTIYKELPVIRGNKATDKLYKVR